MNWPMAAIGCRTLSWTLALHLRMVPMSFNFRVGAVISPIRGELEFYYGIEDYNVAFNL